QTINFALTVHQYIVEAFGNFLNTWIFLPVNFTKTRPLCLNPFSQDFELNPERPISATIHSTKKVPSKLRETSCAFTLPGIISSLW
ncbi:MAG: hypothetical protein WCR04_11675, partial [Fibrobacteraceae bacterium]